MINHPNNIIPMEIQNGHKTNGNKIEMENKLKEAIKNRNFDEYQKWLKLKLVKEEPEKICQDQFEIFEEEFSHYRMLPELKKDLSDLFQENFTDNDPIIQFKIFKGILKGIFLFKQKEALKDKLEEDGLLDRIDRLYSQQTGENEVCYSSFVMLLKEITREHNISILDLPTEFFSSTSLKIIDENLITKLGLHSSDVYRIPKKLILLLIRGIWERVKKIDERFISMYPLTPKRYPKVSNPGDIIEKMKNAHEYSKDPTNFDPTYFKERWLEFLLRKQIIEEMKLKVANDMPFINALENLEKYVLENKEFV